MSGQDDSGAAYPNITPDMNVDGSPGMTKREAFAMAAMQGLCSATDSEGTWMGNDGQGTAAGAVLLADALLAELAKGGAA